MAPWCAPEEKGVVIRKIDIHDEDCTLDMEDFARKLNSKTKLVAVGYASNAVGTINPIQRIIQIATAPEPWFLSMRCSTLPTGQ